MMMDTRTRRSLASLVLLLGMTGAIPLHASDNIADDTADNKYSQAEKKLFLEDHLQNIKQSEVLHYDFRKTGTLEKNFEDTVLLTVKPRSGKGRGVEVAYLTGERKVILPAMEDAQGNPVILYFLEKDVREMHRRLGGSENYFRSRIRVALAQAAEVHPVTVKFGGKDIVASEVVVHPFANDPMKARLQKFENKSYAFTLSDQVPGGIYQLRTWLADTGTTAGADQMGKMPLLEETLSFGPRGK